MWFGWTLCLPVLWSFLHLTSSALVNDVYKEPEKLLLNNLTVDVSVSLLERRGKSSKTTLLRTSNDLGQILHSLRKNDQDIEVTVLGLHQPLILYLQKSTSLIVKGLVRKYFSPVTGRPVISRKDDMSLANCYYTGKVVGPLVNESFVSLDLCRGVHGIIETSEQEYEISSIQHDSKFTHFLSQRNYEEDDVPHKCGTDDEEIIPLPRYGEQTSHKRFKRDIKLPAGSTMQTRYIEIYAVADFSLFKSVGSVEAAETRVINIMNYASGLYRQLNIYLALVGIEVWNTGDQISYEQVSQDSRGIDSGKLLTQFNRYRHFRINFEMPNDNGQLFTAQVFHGGLIGKGSTRGICTQTDSGGVTFDGSTRRYARAATTMAHELGHNLGLTHSDSDVYYGKKCECPADNDPTFTDCIMHSSANPYKQSRKWSPCTVDSLHKYFTEHNLDHCLKNVPEKLTVVGNTPICGNFFVEEGEECDCGQPADCTSKCCDPTTCKLHTNATCATGPCCDLEICKLRPISYPCQPAQDGECDLEETCSGTSEWCPDNTYKRNGEPCNNRADAFCYDGKCSSHNSQCHFIWGDESAEKSSDICYQNYNNYSAYYGNCGWESVTDNYNRSTVEKKYKSCQAEQDKFCGLLHCSKDSPRDLKTKIMNFPLVIYYQPYRGQVCLVTSFDVGYQVYDPGQVPNGAKCAENKMCVNSKCTPVPEKPKQCHCSGNGVCNQHMQCHCDMGWAPPNCNKPGLGGSVTSNPPVIAGSNISVTVGLVTFFCGVVPIIAAIVIVAYCRRYELKRVAHRWTGRYQKTATKPTPPAEEKKTPKVRPPVPANPGPVGKLTAAYKENRKDFISQPHLDSTTNNKAEVTGGLKPTRKAPSVPSLSHVNSTEAVYENVRASPSPRLPASNLKPKPPMLPKPPAKPATPPKVKPKPNIVS